MKEVKLNLTIDEEVNLGCAFLDRLDELYRTMKICSEANYNYLKRDMPYFLNDYYSTTSLWYKLHHYLSLDSQYDSILNKQDRIKEIEDGLSLREYKVTEDILREYAQLRLMVEATE